MSKRKTMDKAQARERRNRLLQSAAAAELSLTEGVREMRAIAGMTQEDFAGHREVSARVIKAIELGQGNPTVATLNRIGEFFGLEVGFVPVRCTLTGEARPSPNETITLDLIRELEKSRNSIMHDFSKAFAALEVMASSLPRPNPAQENAPADTEAASPRTPTKRKSDPH